MDIPQIHNIFSKNSIANHTPLSFFIRLIIVSVIAIGSLPLIFFLVGDTTLYSKLRPVHYVIFILVFNSLSESQILIDNILEYFFPVPYKLRIRLSIQFLSGFLLLIFSIWIIIAFIDPEMKTEVTSTPIYIGLLMGLLFVSLITNGLTTERMAKKLYFSAWQLDAMKQEKLLMNYNSLQDKLNPHFLFNNLSVLRGLMYTDIEIADDFIEDFADVYRYVLKNSDKQLVALSEEIEFIHSYLELHKARLKEGLNVTFKIPDEDKNKEIAPLTLQLLIENAIKHNVATKETPLTISIESALENILVTNSIQKKESTYSTQMGLKNLIRRYELLSRKTITVENNGKIFKVRIPLI